jgi:hypothetical protein
MTAKHHHDDDTTLIKAKRGFNRVSRPSAWILILGLIGSTVNDHTLQLGGGTKGPTWAVIRADEAEISALKTEVARLQQRLDDWQPTQPTKGHR